MIYIKKQTKSETSTTVERFNLLLQTILNFHSGKGLRGFYLLMEDGWNALSQNDIQWPLFMEAALLKKILSFLSKLKVKILLFSLKFLLLLFA